MTESMLPACEGFIEGSLATEEGEFEVGGFWGCAAGVADSLVFLSWSVFNNRLKKDRNKCYMYNSRSLAPKSQKASQRDPF